MKINDFKDRAISGLFFIDFLHLNKNISYLSSNKDVKKEICMLKKAKKIIFSTILVVMFFTIALGIEMLGDYIAAKKVTAVMTISTGEDLDGMDLTDSVIKEITHSVECSNLTVGKEYTVKREVMSKSGNVVKGVAKFTAEDEHVWINFVLDR